MNDDLKAPPKKHVLYKTTQERVARVDAYRRVVATKFGTRNKMIDFIIDEFFAARNAAPIETKKRKAKK